MEAAMADAMEAMLLKSASKVRVAARKLRPSDLGSGIGGRMITAWPCDCCKKNAAARAFECAACHLVSYCSQECKDSSSANHKREVCESPMMRAAPKTKSNCELKDSVHIWGNVPATSIIRRDLLLQQHMKQKGAAQINAASGEQINVCFAASGEQINVCFAASGDLRNVVQTVCSFPPELGTLTIYINDLDPLVAVRNFLMLELLRTYGKDAIECVVALWYSVAMTEAQSVICKSAGWSSLERSGSLKRLSRIFTMAAGDEELIKAAADKNVPALNLRFSSGSTMNVDFKDNVWSWFNCWLTAKDTPSSIMQARIRKVEWTMLGASLLDSGSSRVMLAKYLTETGVLLPFSLASAKDYYPSANDLIWDTNHRLWVQEVFTSPLSGWTYEDMKASGQESGVPSKDLHGALFFHVKKMLTKFVEAIDTGKMHFKLTCMDASELARDCKQKHVKFQAVDTSNIADSNYLGMKTVLGDWGPLLEPEGTLITMQMNWFSQDWTLALEAQLAKIPSLLGFPKPKQVKTQLSKVLKGRGDFSKTTLGSFLKMWEGNASMKLLACCTRTDLAYAKHLQDSGLPAYAKRLGLQVKDKHELVPPRLFTGLGADEVPAKCFLSPVELEYHLALLVNSFMERSTEWKLSA